MRQLVAVLVLVAFGCAAGPRPVPMPEVCKDTDIVGLETGAPAPAPGVWVEHGCMTLKTKNCAEAERTAIRCMEKLNEKPADVPWKELIIVSVVSFLAGAVAAGAGAVYITTR